MARKGRSNAGIKQEASTNEEEVVLNTQNSKLIATISLIYKSLMHSYCYK